MRYVRFLARGIAPQPLLGALNDDGNIEVLRGDLFGTTTPTDQVMGLAEIDAFLPPVNPPNIFALGKNYADHAAEFDGDVPAEPVIFLKATTSVTAHRQPIVLPQDFPDEVDYEAELAVVIGRTARRVSRAEAAGCVLGVTCANDVTQRKCQKELDGQWARAKSFDTFCPLGPTLVTGLDLSDRQVQLRLNGEVMQEASTRDLLWDVPATIELLSSCFTLQPGTVILTGTPAGVGGARTPPVYLQAGDRVEVDISGVGVLENEVKGP